MANGQEETVNLDIYQLLVGLALSLNQVGAFYAVVAKEAEGVVFEEYLDVLCCHHTVLHYFRCTQEGFSHDEIYLFGQSAEVECVFAGGIATSNNGYRLLAIEETIAGGTGRNTLPVVFLLVVQS